MKKGHELVVFKGGFAVDSRWICSGFASVLVDSRQKGSEKPLVLGGFERPHLPPL